MSDPTLFDLGEVRKPIRSKGTPYPIGSGPAGETCRTCKHLRRIQRANTYLKCGLMERCWTGGPGTDVKAKWPACKAWEPEIVEHDR